MWDYLVFWLARETYAPLLPGRAKLYACIELSPVLLEESANLWCYASDEEVVWGYYLLTNMMSLFIRFALEEATIYFISW